MSSSRRRATHSPEGELVGIIVYQEYQVFSIMISFVMRTRCYHERLALETVILLFVFVYFLSPRFLCFVCFVCFVCLKKKQDQRCGGTAADHVLRQLAFCGAAQAVTCAPDALAHDPHALLQRGRCECESLCYTFYCTLLYFTVLCCAGYMWKLRWLDFTVF